jgi:hypothetical protein
MRWLGIFFVIVAGLAVLVGHTLAQTAGGSAVGFACIGDPSTHDCTGGSPAGLRGYMGPALGAIPYYATVAGYFAPGDSAGGNYVRLGAASSVCATYGSGIVSGTGSVGASKLTGLSGTGFHIGYLAVGELVGASGTDGMGNPIQAAPGTEIASIDTTHSNITLTLPLTGTAIGSVTTISVTFTSDNHGTLIIDSEAGTVTPQCWQKTNYRGDPHEYGAYGDGVTDDTTAMQYWLGAAGAPSTAFGSMAAPPTNFGPWIATIPANYLVSSPLVCPPNADIEAQTNLNDGSGSSPVRIFAAPLGTFSGVVGEPGLMMASDYCRLSGIELDATGIGNFYLQTMATPANNSAMLSNVVSIAGVYPGMPISDGNNAIPHGTYVVSTAGLVSPYTITMSKNAACSPCASESVLVTGFDTLDIVGTHVSVENRTLLTGGYANLRCGGGLPYNDGLQVKNAEILNGFDEGINLGGCANIRLIGDLISGNGDGGTVGSTYTPPLDGNGVYFAGQELTVADGVIEEAGGVGLNLNGAIQVSVQDMYFDQNGKFFGNSAINIDNTSYATICGNHIHRSGGFPVTPVTASQIYFLGANDNINLCGNIYYPDYSGNEATLRPLYAYDAASNTTLTNTHLYEQPSPHASGQVLSPAAALLLAPLQVPQFTNEITGLTLSNSSPSTPSAIVDIAAGSAADSTGTALIQMPPVTGAPACVVNLGSSTFGVNALDVSPAITAGTTYFLYAISGAGGSNNGATASNCIASTSSTGPSFINTGTAYSLTTTATVSGSTLYNVASIAGVKAGDLVFNSTYLHTGTTVQSVGTSTHYLAVTPYTGGGGSCATSSPYDCYTVLYPGSPVVQQNMEVSDSKTNQIANGSGPCTSGGMGGQGFIANNTTIAMVNPGGSLPHVIKLSIAYPIPTIATDCFTYSGGNTITLSSNAITNSTTPFTITIYTGLYRMLGALYAPVGSSDIVQFAQDGDTFLLNAPVYDVQAKSLTTSAVNVPLPSVPAGIVVEALGRCVGGNGYVLLYTPPPAGATGPMTPGLFTSTPGYSINSTTPQTAFPVRLYTDSSTDIKAVASGASTLNCMTDGWVWHRAQ